MKLKRSYVIILFVLFLFSNVIAVNAMKTGFSTEDLTEETKNMFISNIDISLLTEEPAKRGIKCFDVNEQGMIAIAQNGTLANTVCVYTSDGTFLYGYTFRVSQSIAVEWDNENLNIFFVRSDNIVSLDPKGTILGIKNIPDTIDNGKHRRDLLYSTERIIGDTTYVIRNDMGILNWLALSYSQISSINASGEEKIIYDINSIQINKIIKIIFIIWIIICINLVLILVQRVDIRSLKKSRNTSDR